MQFPWQSNGDTFSLNVGVIWEKSVEESADEQAQPEITHT